MTAAEDAEGRKERELARLLIAALPASAAAALRLGPIDLGSGAEHLLYTALRQPAPDASPPTLVRALARIARAIAGGRSHPGQHRGPRAVVFVTRSVHATLYQPVDRLLSDAGFDSILVDAESRPSRETIGGVHLRLAGTRPRKIAHLVMHALAVQARLRRVPRSWAELVSESDAVRLCEVLRRGLPLIALELARIDAVLEAFRPNAAICFSESGLLARTVPAVAAMHAIPSLDLPHAEAADPWGVAGAGYDGFAVYGPRSRVALEAGGIPADRIVEIGPLRYDALLARPQRNPVDGPKRVLFASQPSDSRKAATHPDVKRAALSAARAATAALAPAELVVVPHPVEPPGEAERFVAELEPEGPPVRVAREHGLHELLDGAWLLVTASSQSVFEAIVSGVPAVTVNPTDGPDPVSFADEGIAIGVRTDDDAARVAASLRSADAREDAVARGRAALGDRIGPLDGRATERAAKWILSVATDAAENGTAAARR